MTEPEVAFRAATADDLNAAAELIRGQPLFEPYGMTPEGLAKSLRAALGRDEELHVATVADRVVGLVWFQLRGTFGRSGYLRLLVTDGTFQGQGIGKRLLELAEQLVFAEVDDMFLLVSAANEGAKRFYERHGYSAVGTVSDYVAAGLDEVVLRRTRPR